ncbi:uncharacterized protein [Montipora capricornis]|uniref:uncharacterized protein isoform X3 n=1 Tax=Montipora capricornis TaxID=246305 RepID=UPI0035F1C531
MSASLNFLLTRTISYGLGERDLPLIGSYKCMEMAMKLDKFKGSGFLISHHGSFMGALPCWTWIVSWLCNLTGCCSVSLRIEKELIPFQETSTIGSSEKSLSYTVEHQVWISYITPWLLHGGRFHVGLGLFRGFVISQAAAQCHSVLRKNLFLFKRLPLSGHQKIKSLSYTVEHQVITQNIPLQ